MKNYLKLEKRFLIFDTIDSSIVKQHIVTKMREPLIKGLTYPGDPGAVSLVGRKGAMKVFKHEWKSPWVPTLTGQFPNGQANAGS